MKLDPKIISALIARKSTTLLAGIAIGAVLAATNDDVLALVRQFIAAFAGGGGAFVVVSTILSLLNDSKKAAAIEEVKELKVEANENLYKAPEGYMLVKAKSEAAEPLK
jgi:hypothetical protein